MDNAELHISAFIYKFAGMRNVLLRIFLILSVASLCWVAASGSVSNSSGALSGEDTQLTARDEGDLSASDKEIRKDEQGRYTPFRLSMRTAETSLQAPNTLTIPAQTVAQRRTPVSERTSLAKVIAEHSGSTIVESRFGLLDFKHIIHSNHSLLLRVCVLQI